jgi:hypothetical protein
VNLRKAPPAEWLVLAAFGALVATGFGWGLPNADTWCADSISPRSCGLGAIAESYWWGHYHTYPPLQMALLTVLSAPWMGLALLRIGAHREALGVELSRPLYMTAIEISSRLLTAAMALGLLWNTMRLWSRLGGRRVGIGAGVVLLGNATLVYYAHTGNLEIAYLFWISLALLEIDRVAAGEPRLTRALLASTCAALTKDQAAAALALPIVVYLVVLPMRTAASPRTHLVRLARAAAWSVALYAIVSGALVNERGFARRVAFLLGPASRPWAGYPATLAGRMALAHDLARALPHFTSWPLALLVATGVAAAAATGDGRARRLLPLACAVSFTLGFNLAALRTEDRFELPQSMTLLPYAAFAVDRAWQWSEGTSAGVRRLCRGAVVATAAAGAALAAVSVASLLGTLLTDPRYSAEKYLETVPAGAHVEVYGTTRFLPRVPDRLEVVRPGIDALAEREPTSIWREVVDPAMDPRPRAPDLIVLSTELSRDPIPPLVQLPPGYPPLAPYRDRASRELFRRLEDGSLGFVRVFRATCSLPWPLRCHEVHGSTGGEVWIYGRRPS